MPRYAQNVALVLADAGSNKRALDMDFNRFNPSSPAAKGSKVPFDAHVAKELAKWVNSENEFRGCLSYLDAIGYGMEYDSKQLITALDKFSEPHVPTRAWMRAAQQASENLYRVLRHDFGDYLQLHIFKDDAEIMEALPKKDAHAGWIYLERGYRTKGEYEGQLFTLWQEALTEVRRIGSHGYPILIGTRRQCSGAFEDGARTGRCKKKTRLVNMVDVRQILSEMVFSIPLQKALSYSSIYIGSRNPGELSRLIQDRRFSSRHWLSLDYSAYDQSIPGWLIQMAFDVLARLYDPSQFSEYKWLWDAIVYDFKNAPIMGPQFSMVRRKDGVPSGSMFTQIIDTLCNWLMIDMWRISFEAKHHYHAALSTLICGDDNLIFIDFDEDVNWLKADILGYIAHNFGVKGNVDKTETGSCATANPKFLSRVWRLDGAWRDWQELVAHMCYPERFRTYSRRGRVTDKCAIPELIVWSYILAYPAGMKELIDVESFVYHYRMQIPTWSGEDILKYQTGSWAYQVKYLKASHAKYSRGQFKLSLNSFFREAS